MVLHHYCNMYATSYPYTSAILPTVLVDDFGNLLQIGDKLDVAVWPSDYAQDVVVPVETKNFVVRYPVEEED
jgi:hypothetical protein